jgi:hypothetical protein
MKSIPTQEIDVEQKFGSILLCKHKYECLQVEYVQGSVPWQVSLAERLAISQRSIL